MAHPLVFPTFELPLCVENTQVCWYGVEATAANHIHSFVQGLSVVLQLHTLQELSTKCICNDQSYKTNTYINGYLLPHLRLATDVHVVSSICYTSLDHWFTVKPVLKGQRGHGENYSQETRRLVLYV